jgi:hypothetical protein
MGIIDKIYCLGVTIEDEDDNCILLTATSEGLTVFENEEDLFSYLNELLIKPIVKLNNAENFYQILHEQLVELGLKIVEFTEAQASLIFKHMKKDNLLELRFDETSENAFTGVLFYQEPLEEYIYKKLNMNMFRQLINTTHV